MNAKSLFHRMPRVIGPIVLVVALSGCAASKELEQPYSPQELVSQARVALADGDPDAAIYLYGTALEQAPDNTELLLEFADVSQAAGHLGAAASTLARVVGEMLAVGEKARDTVG